MANEYAFNLLLIQLIPDHLHPHTHWPSQPQTPWPSHPHTPWAFTPAYPLAFTPAHPLAFSPAHALSLTRIVLFGYKILSALYVRNQY
jgi:hypothetical protein